MASSSAESPTQRLMRELQQLMKDPPVGISVATRGGNMSVWKAVIMGLPGTPFENGAFEVLLGLHDYPQKPPIVRFTCQMFHPNVMTAVGHICLDLLQEKWRPCHDIATVLVYIQKMLGEPNTESPLNARAAKLYDTNRAEYNRRVAAIVEESWEHLEEDKEDNDEDERTVTRIRNGPGVGSAPSGVEP